MKIRFVQLSVPVMELLAAGELAGASRESGLALTGYFVSERGLRTWRRRAVQVSADPASGPWVQGAVISEPDSQIVGWSGFHGPPDTAGMVEVAYAVDPDFRRQGYAKAMLAGLLERASADPVVRTVRATISPDNAGSLATVRAFGFAQTGEQWDDEDGLELVFEIADVDCTGAVFRVLVQSLNPSDVEQSSSSKPNRARVEAALLRGRRMSCTSASI